MKNLFKYYNSVAGILILAVLGIIIGYVFGEDIVFLKPFGDLFISLIRMMLIPIIFFTLVNATASFNEHKNALHLGGFALIYFFVTSFLSGLFGVMIAYYLQPGYGIAGELPNELLTLSNDLKDVGNVKLLTFWDFVFNMIPNNVFKSLADGHVLPILFFAIFMGIGISYTKNENKKFVSNAISVINDVMMWMVAKIMYLAPIAVFSLMAYLVGFIGIEVVFLVSKLFAIIISGLIIWLYVVQALIVSTTTRVSYIKFIRTILPLQLLAFSTSSSLVSLPKNLEVCQKMGADSKIASFILPLGATLNMNGSAFYYCVVTVFFAQMFGVKLDMHLYILIPFVAALASMGTPGVPGLSMTIIMVMVVANVPLLGVPLIIAIDRILDMFITTVNVIGDTACVLISNRIFGNKNQKAHLNNDAVVTNIE